MEISKTLKVQFWLWRRLHFTQKVQTEVRSSSLMKFFNAETCLKACEATLRKAIPAFVKEPGQIISSSMWSDLWLSWIRPKDLCPLWCDEPLACLLGTWMWEPCSGPNGAGNLSESLIRIAEREAAVHCNSSHARPVRMQRNNLRAWRNASYSLSRMTKQIFRLYLYFSASSPAVIHQPLLKSSPSPPINHIVTT